MTQLTKRIDKGPYDDENVFLTPQEHDDNMQKIEDGINANATAITSLENGEAGRVFDDRAAATTFYNAQSPAPEDGIIIYLIAEKEYHKWDSTEATHKTTFVRSLQEILNVWNALDTKNAGSMAETENRIDEKLASANVANNTSYYLKKNEDVIFDENSLATNSTPVLRTYSSQKTFVDNVFVPKIKVKVGSDTTDYDNFAFKIAVINPSNNVVYLTDELLYDGTVVDDQEITQEVNLNVLAGNRLVVITNSTSAISTQPSGGSGFVRYTEDITEISVGDTLTVATSDNDGVISTALVDAYSYNEDFNDYALASDIPEVPDVTSINEKLETFENLLTITTLIDDDTYLASDSSFPANNLYVNLKTYENDITINSVQVLVGANTTDLNDFGFKLGVIDENDEVVSLTNEFTFSGVAIDDEVEVVQDISLPAGNKLFIISNTTSSFKLKSTDGYGYSKAHQNIGNTSIGTTLTYATTDNNGILGIGWTATQVVYKDVVDVEQLTYDPLRNAKINCLGDSLTKNNVEGEENSYPTFINQLTGATTRNYGAPGTRLSNNDYNTVGDGMVIRYSAMDNDATHVLIYGGTNDCASVTIGATDSTDDTTFNGALNVMIQGLFNKYPTAKIGFITPDNSPAKGVAIEDYVNAIIDRCAENGIPVLNLYKNNCIGWGNATRETALTRDDDLHTNAAGNLFKAKQIIAFLRSL